MRGDQPGRAVMIGNRKDEFDRVVEELRKHFATAKPLATAELLRVLRTLAARDPRTQEELTRLEAESFVLGERIQKSALCNDTPEIVSHFLSDADVRFKDPEYSRLQCKKLTEWVEKMEGMHGT